MVEIERAIPVLLVDARGAIPSSFKTTTTVEGNVTELISRLFSATATTPIETRVPQDFFPVTLNF